GSGGRGRAWPRSGGSGCESRRSQTSRLPAALSRQRFALCYNTIGTAFSTRIPMRTARPGSRALIVTLLDNIRWEHTVFALPFAYIGAVLAAGGLSRPSILLWITLAM